MKCENRYLHTDQSCSSSGPNIDSQVLLMRAVIIGASKEHSVEPRQETFRIVSMHRRHLLCPLTKGAQDDTPFSLLVRKEIFQNGSFTELRLKMTTVSD